MTSDDISFIDPEVQRCPFAAYEQVRQDGPVYFDKSSGFYIVTGYDEIRKAAADTDTFSSMTGQLMVKDAPYQAKVDAIYDEHGVKPTTVLVIADPPLHTFHRSLLDKVFTLKRVRQMEVYLESVVDEMIDGFIDRGEVEFYHEMALKVPNYVISDQLGVPRERYRDFKRWADAVVQEGDPSNGEERQLEITRTICELQQYLIAVADEYRRTPRDCILSDLVHTDVDGRKLSMAEILSIVAQILPAGSDTTVSAMASAMYRIVITPGLEDELRNDPSLVTNFIEEVLRLEAPVQGLYRRATRDTEIAGTPIPEGSTVVLRFGAGNRDPKQFAEPETLDIRRKGARNHLTFGTGPHFCVGNQLARGEMRVALTRLLERAKNFRLARGEDSVEWMAHFFAYGLERLELTFERIDP